LIEFTPVKHILMIAYNFPPCSEAGVFRTLRFVKYLPASGWLPIVLTVKNGTYNRVDPLLLKEIPEGLQVIRVPSFELRRWFQTIAKISRKNKSDSVPSGIQSTTKTQSFKMGEVLLKNRRFASKMVNNLLKTFLFPDQKIGWLPFVIAEVRRFYPQHPFNVVYTSGGPWTSHIAGARIKKIFHVPWVADYRDFWTLYRHPSQAIGGKFRQSLEEKLEHRLMKTADLNIFTTEATRDGYIKKYPDLDPRKMRTLTHGFDPQDFFKPVTRIPKDFLEIIHAGTASQPIYRMEIFFKALGEWFQKNPFAREQVLFRFIGGLGNNERYVEQYGLRDVVSCEPAIAHKRVIQQLQSASVLLVVLGDHSPATLAMKIPEYLSAGKPIWAVCNKGESSKIVHASGCGWVSSSHDVSAIQISLDLIWNAFIKHELIKMHPKQEFVAQFDGRKLTSKLAEWLNEIVNKSACE
jgi:glycosyltransferase involved in cell wall biosynthesis